MSNKLVTGFNNHLQDFFEKLYQMLPEQEHLRTIKNTLHLGKVYDKEIYIKYFYYRYIFELILLQFLLLYHVVTNHLF